MTHTLNLKRHRHDQPDFQDFDRQLRLLERLVRQQSLWTSPAKEQWLADILAFQAEDGGFALVDSPHIESDARVEFYYEPTYLCSALLMRELMASDNPAPEIKAALQRALPVCRGRGLQGHGFDSEEGEEKAMGWFLRCGLEDFLHSYAALDPAFHELAENLLMKWNHVFVYGTLLSTGSRTPVLNRAIYKGSASIEGYTLYNLGSFPAARQGGSESIQGEVYLVHGNTLRELDRIEGHGTLFRRYPAWANGGNFHMVAQVYLYVEELPEAAVILPAQQPYGGSPDELVWYATYGSSINEKRLFCYIQGGTCPQSGKMYPGCADRRPPRAVMTVHLPYERYFAKLSPSWSMAGVAFLDPQAPGETWGKAYLINRAQYQDIRQQEGPTWYDHDMLLGYHNGIEVRTLTHSTRTGPEREPSEKYLEIIENASRTLDRRDAVLL